MPGAGGTTPTSASNHRAAPQTTGNGPQELHDLFQAALVGPSETAQATARGRFPLRNDWGTAGPSAPFPSTLSAGVGHEAIRPSVFPLPRVPTALGGHPSAPRGGPADRSQRGDLFDRGASSPQSLVSSLPENGHRSISRTDCQWRSAGSSVDRLGGLFERGLSCVVFYDSQVFPRCVAGADLAWPPGQGDPKSLGRPGSAVSRASG